MRVLGCMIALALMGCPPAGLQLPETTPDVLQAGSLQREVRALTDLDSVRDVVEGGGLVYVATDRGLLVFGESTTRMGRNEGLPSDDVRALAISANGVVTVGTANGFVEVTGNQISNPVVPNAPVGEIVALHTQDDGTRWACGQSGLARLRDGVWSGYGEAMQCTGLWATPEGRLWVGTTNGLLYLDADDVIREHVEGRGLPAGWVRGVVPAQPGQAFVLVQNASESHLAWFDGNRWYDYTVADFDRPVVGLARVGTETVMFTRGYAFTIRDATRASGVPLHPLARGDRLQVLGYRARQLPGAVASCDREAIPARPPVRLAAVPPNHPTIEAPGFVVAPLSATGQNVYGVHAHGGVVYVADRNQGVSALTASGVGRSYRSRDLVAERDLQVQSDERGRTWVLTDEGVLAEQNDGALRRVATPEGVRCWSMTAAARGLYVACTVNGTPNAIRVYRRSGDDWAPAIDTVLTFGAADDAPRPQVVSTPMIGVRDDEETWLAMRVRMPDGTGPVMRGVAQINGETVLYHHSRSDPAVDGEGSLVMPDDFSSLDVNEEGNVWFSTLNGAVRIGNHQAIVFGEARGVRGEVVSDVLVGTQARVWVAAAEGPGYYYNREFEFRMPQAVRATRPIGLALDPRGNIWGAGPNGLVRYDGNDWSVFAADSGLPTTELVDVEAAADGEIWVLGRDQVVVLGAPTQREVAPE